MAANENGKEKEKPKEHDKEKEKANEMQLFTRGEKVLCYEPDKSKARVLYDSKILAVYERKDAKNNNARYFDYKVHFQGWNASWDRNVRCASLLKDNPENRGLQRELAEAAQLQKSGGYSYKDTKETKTVPAGKKKRGPKGAAGNVEDPNADPLELSVAELPAGAAAEQDLLTKKKKKGRKGKGQQQQDKDKDKDTGGQRQSDKQADDKQEGGRKSHRDKRGTGEAELSTRPSGSRKDVEIGDEGSVICLKPSTKGRHNSSDEYRRQEDRVVLRISERLRAYMEYDYNMVCKYGKQHAIPATMPVVTILEHFVKQRAVELAIGIKQDSSRARSTQSRNARMEREYDRVMSKVCMLKEVVDGLRIYFQFHLEDHLLYKGEKEYLNSFLTPDIMHKCCYIVNNSYDFVPTHVNSVDEDGNVLGNEEYERQLQRCLAYIRNTNGKNKNNKDKEAYKLPVEMRCFLCETFNWRLLSPESPPEKSMVFGAPHLARLMVKMPEFLNASPISNEKLEDLLPHIDAFIKYLENHKDWFDKDNYAIPLGDQDLECVMFGDLPLVKKKN